MSNQISEHAKEIIASLELEWGDPTRKWMSYRIAELMDKVENTSSVDEKQQIQAQCDSLIVRLWAYNRADDLIKAARIIAPNFTEYHAESDYNALAPYLVDDEQRPNDLIQRLALVLKANQLQSDLIRLLFLTMLLHSLQENPELAKEHSEDTLSDSISIYLKSIETALPNAANLDPYSLSQIEEFVTGKLQKINHLRMVFFEESNL